MILLCFLFIALLGLVAFGVAFWQKRQLTRETHDIETAADFFRDQMSALSDDLASGTLDTTQYDQARTEAERHLLDNAIPPATAARNGPILWLGALCAVILIPCAGMFLYSLNGRPLYDPQVSDPRAAAARQAALPSLEQLGRFASQTALLTSDDPDYAPSYVKLGDMAFRAGLVQQAVSAWKKALDVRFIPALALRIAETEANEAGTITPDALSLYQRALAAAPPDAPWRMAVEERIATGEHEKDERTMREDDQRTPKETGP